MQVRRQTYTASRWWHRRHWRSVSSVVTCVLALHILPIFPIHAQAGAITTDTGALAPGHRDFSRYTTLPLCYAAVRTTQSALQRTLALHAEAVALQRTPERDTLPVGVAATARTCIARFSMRSAAPEDIPLLFMLALVAQQDSLASALLARQLASATTDSARLSAASTAIDTYLAAIPARVTAAETLVTHLQTRMPGAVGARLWLQAHDELLQLQWQERDEKGIRQEATQILDFLHGEHPGITGSDWREIALRAYQALAALAYVEHLASADAADSAIQAVAQRARQDLIRSGLDTVWYDKQHDHYASSPGTPAAMRAAGYERVGQGIDWSTKPLADIAELVKPVGGVSRSDSAARRPPLITKFWIPSGENTADPTTNRPPSTTVSVEYKIPYVCLTEYESPLYSPGQCAEPLTQLQQWQQTYGPTGVQIVVVTALHGHLLYSGNLPPAEEARQFAWYIHEYGHLAVPIAILDTPSVRTFLADPSTDNESFVMVRDHTGRVVYAASAHNVGSPFLAIVLAHAFGQTVPQHASDSLSTAVLAVPPSVHPATFPAQAP